jgi:hypothetical protein
VGEVTVSLERSFECLDADEDEPAAAACWLDDPSCCLGEPWWKMALLRIVCVRESVGMRCGHADRSQRCHQHEHGQRGCEDTDVQLVHGGRVAERGQQRWLVGRDQVSMLVSSVLGAMSRS